MFFKKKIKEELSGHQLAVATIYLEKAISRLEVDLSVCQLSDSSFDNWAIIHDITCLKETIKYLERRIL